MSGSAGGNRINRSSVTKTVEQYINNVLKKFPGFTGAKISGSYNTSDKQDFGDIDLIVHLEASDKKGIKKELAQYLSSLPDNIIIPFKSEKYKGKKTLNSGEIVTILYPIIDNPGQYVQIDNIISISGEEAEFKKEFLDYPAEIQGLLLGLAKVICLEEDPQTIFKRLGITNVPKLKENQEYEFNLSSSGLTLRIVTLDGFKEIDRTDVWKSSNWSTIKELFSGFNIDGSFEYLLKDISSKIKNPRSKNRIRGIFNSMVSIKSGEVGTPKGDNKQKSSDKVNTTLAENNFGRYIASLLLEYEKRKIALYPGAFKPPHKGHLNVVEQLADRVDEIIILISPKPREGVTADESAQVWELYKQGLDSSLANKILVEISKEASPIKEVYDIVKDNPDTDYIVVFGKEEGDRYKTITKYPNVEIFDGGTAFEGINATGLRVALKSDNVSELQKYIPENIRVEDFYNIFKKPKPQEWPDTLKETYHAQNTDDTFQAYVDRKELPIENAAEDFNFNIDDMKMAFTAGNIVVLSDDIWSKLENTNSWKVKSLTDAIKYAKRITPHYKQTYEAVKNNAPIDAPLVLNWGKQRYYLVDGELILLFCKALGKSPHVLLGAINTSNNNATFPLREIDLTPRRTGEERAKNFIIATQKRIQQYIKDGSKGDLNLSDSKITSLPNNLKAGRSLNLRNTPITSLPNNLEVGGDLDLRNTPITSLSDDLKVGGSLYLQSTKITSLPNNLKAGRSLYLNDSKITSLPNNLTVRRNLSLSDTKITSLPNNLKVGGILDLSNTPITSLPDNLKVGGYLDLSNTPITSLPDNLKVGGDLYLSNTPITSLPNNLKVGGNLDLGDTSLSKKYTSEEIIKMIEDKGGYVKGEIYGVKSNLNENTESIKLKDEQVDVIKQFIKYLTKELDLKELPNKLTLSYNTDEAKSKHTFGYFDPNTNAIWLYVKDRNVADILRTLAHEFVHRKQAEEGRIEQNSGDTGSEIENEANAMAGVLLRNFGKNHEEIYEVKKSKNKLITEIDLTPRRTGEERDKNHLIATQKKIQQYIKDGSKGDLNLNDTPITSLPNNLTKVGGSLYLNDTQITSLPNNLEVGGDLDLGYTQITSLPNNLEVGGDLYLINTPITSLSDNLKVGGSLYLQSTKITSLPNNLKVGGNLDLGYTPITSLPDNLKVGGNLDLSNTPITSLPDNLKVGGYLGLQSTKITSLPNNLKVGGNLYLYNSKITSLPDNLTVGGILNLTNTPITSLPNNLKVGGNLDLSGTQITSLPDNLTVGRYLNLFNTSLSKKYTKDEIRKMIEDKGGYVKGEIYEVKRSKNKLITEIDLTPRRTGEERDKNHLIATQKKIQQYIKDGSKGDLNLYNSKITSLPDNLTVGGSLYLYNTPIISLPNNLTKVGGDLDLRYTPITSLPNNLEVGGDLYLSGTQITSLPDNLTVGRSLYLQSTKITSLPNNLEVGGDLDLRNTPITSLPNNLEVGGDLDLRNTPITSLSDNLKVGGSLYLQSTKITSLPNNLKVGGSLYLSNTSLSKKYTKDEIKKMIEDKGGYVKNL